MSQCDGVPSDRSILKLKLCNIVQDRKTVDSRKGKYNELNLTL